ALAQRPAPQWAVAPPDLEWSGRGAVAAPPSHDAVRALGLRKLRWVAEVARAAALRLDDLHELGERLAGGDGDSRLVLAVGDRIGETREHQHLAREPQGQLTRVVRAAAAKHFDRFRPPARASP